jgi:hypothetical protein
MCASDPQRLHDYLYALVQQFAVKGITAMFTLEIGARSTGAGLGESALGRVSYMSDNVLWLALSHDSNTKTHREITCTKARGSEQSLASHEFYIAKDGLHIS